MKKPAKVALGILNILPFVYFVFFFVFMFFVVGIEPQHSDKPPWFLIPLFATHVSVILLNFALMVVYIINLFNNERVPADKRVLWAVVLFLGNMMAFPFYWYLYIWREPELAQAKPVEDNTSTDGKIYCQKCGASNDDFRYKCTSCGSVLHQTAQGSSAPVNYSSIGVIFPYKNVPAISAYYLGVFSAIPILGIVPGIAAFLLGIKGRRIAKEHPERKGTVHAWAGIILGGLFGSGYILLLAFLIAKL